MKMTHKLTFTTRDILLQNFFLMEDKALPISYLVELAVTNYALTGKYLSVATVTTEEPENYLTKKAVYFKKDGIASRYLDEQKKQGKAYNAVIKLILEQSLTIGRENRLLTKAEYLAHRQKINAYLLNDGEKPSLGLYDYAHNRNVEEGRLAEVDVKRENPVERKSVTTKTMDISSEPKKTSKKPKKSGKADLSFADNFVFGNIE